MKGKKLWKKLLAGVLTAALVVSAFSLPGAGREDVKADDLPVIFISDNSVGTGTGASAADPLQADEYTSSDTTDAGRVKATALYKAWETLMAAGGGTIVICGEYEITKAMCYKFNSGWSDCNFQLPKTDAPKRDVTITYTSVYNGVDYRTTNNAKLVLAESQVHLAFPTATVTENLTVQAKGNQNYISAGTSHLTLSQGTNFVKYVNVYPTLIGNFHRGDQISDTIVNKPTHITVDIGEGNTVGEIFGQSKYARAAQNSSTTIDIVSGTVGNIYGDSFDRANSSYGPFTINISGGKIAGEICGTKMGFNTSGTNRTVTVNVTGGDFSECTGIVTAKSSVADANKPTAFTVNASDLADPTIYGALKSLITDESITFIEPSFDPTVIFISDNSVGDGTGSSAANPMQADEYSSSDTTDAGRVKATALYKAWEKLIEVGGGTIVICGEYEITKTMCYTMNSGWSDYNMQLPKTDVPKRNITITYTSVYNGVDYRTTNNAKLVLGDSQVHLAFPTETVTENLTVQAKGNQNYISAGTSHLTLSTGTNFLKYANVYPSLLGNFHRGDQIGDTIVNNPTHITVDIGEGNTVGDIYGQSKYARAAQNSAATIDIVSGNVGNIYGDSFDRANSTYGPITINISGGKIAGEICGTKMGFNASSADKTVAINVTGGDFSACTGILAAKSTVGASNKPTSCIIDAREADRETVVRLKALKDADSTLLYKRIIGRSIALAESILVRIQADVDGLSENAAVEALVDGAEAEVQKTGTNADGTAVFTFKIDPSMLADELVITLKDGTEEIDTTTTDIVTYCDELAAANPEDAALLALVADLLEYGAAAQQYTNHNVSKPANSAAWVAGKKTAFAAAASTDKAITGTGDEGAKIKSAYLNLYDVVSVRFKLQVTDMEGLTLQFLKNNAETDDFTVIGDYVEVRSNGAYASELADAVYTLVLLRNGTEIQRAAYSAKSYVYANASSTDAALAAIVQRMWCYGQSAKSYAAGL